MDEGVQLVKADFPTGFPAQLVKRFLVQAMLVDLGLVLNDNLFRDVRAVVKISLNSPMLASP